MTIPILEQILDGKTHVKISGRKLKRHLEGRSLRQAIGDYSLLDDNAILFNRFADYIDSDSSAGECMLEESLIELIVKDYNNLSPEYAELIDSATKNDDPHQDRTIELEIGTVADNAYLVRELRTDSRRDSSYILKYVIFCNRDGKVEVGYGEPEAFETHKSAERDFKSGSLKHLFVEQKEPFWDPRSLYTVGTIGAAVGMAILAYGYFGIDPQTRHSLATLSAFPLGLSTPFYAAGKITDKINKLKERRNMGFEGKLSIEDATN